MAPYVGIVDAVLLQSAATLGGNVDVSFMKEDFARLIAERMLVSGMKSLLSVAGAARGSVVLETLVGMIEAHVTERDSGRRNGHGRGDLRRRANGYAPTAAEPRLEIAAT